ncbi:putative integral membrane protein [Theileria parva strain Muguga]|uniref:Uncharacterized protein n=1 Tax=Theileria parva TaxID=5875 RepID=Q4N4D7_THEPA|nr:putative integral membrane protein [Theileria parva strain Muguga]EAN32986.1 putative integral membrane protein [Theileria parva strain Muguga]|eukprot:XP_765269.1 hypothetical protein [Theileria parva strain Muguga]
MNATKLVSAVLVVAALLVFAAAMFFFFYKKETKVAEGGSAKSADATPEPPSPKVLNVVTYLSNERFNAMKGSLGESYLFDARSKSNSYQFGGVTVSVVSGELPDYPGYTMYTHTFPTPFKGEKLVFDGANSNEFFEDPVTRLTAYWWFNSLLFLTFTAEKTGDTPLTKYFHYTAHFGQDALRWDRFDRDPNTLLDNAVLGPKLDELNVSAGNFVALGLDEYAETPTGAYKTEVDGVTVNFTLARRSSSQTGFVKLTHKLAGVSMPADTTTTLASKPFKVKKVLVSGTELSDLVLTRKPVLSVSVFWWFNIPLVADFELQGGAHEHLTYSVDTNKWGFEVVDKLRSKLFMLKNKLGDPLTLDLSKTADRDQTYTTNGVLVRVSPAATSAAGYKKFTHRFSTGSSHLVGSFSSHGTPQLGLPVLRVSEVSAYYLSDVPLLLKMSMSTSGGMATTYLYFSNNGLGLWKKVVLDDQMSTTAAVLKKLSEDNRALSLTDSYVLDARMKASYLSGGKLVSVTKAAVENLQGFTTYSHSPSVRGPFKFEKFTVAGKDVLPVSEPLQGTTDATVYWYLDVPMLLKVVGTSQPAAPVGPPAQTPPSGSGSGSPSGSGSGSGSGSPPSEASSSAQRGDQPSNTAVEESASPPPTRAQPEATQAEPFNFYYWYNAESKVWSALEEAPTTAEKLKEALNKARATLGKVTLNLGHSSGTFTSGPVTVTVTDSASYDNDPPTSFTKRVHTFSAPFPVSMVKHYDFDVELGNVTEEQYKTIRPANQPLVPEHMVVQRMEVYSYGEVPLHFYVYGVEGTPLRFSNSFKGTLWYQYNKTNVPLKDVLLLQKVQLSHTAKMDVCRGSAKNDELVTYNLKHLASEGSTPVSVSRSEVPNSNGVMLVQHKLPDNVSLKFSALTCGQKILTGLNSDDFHTVMVYYKDRLPMYVKTNSDPKYFAMSGDGALTRVMPPAGATSFTDEQVNTAVTTLSTKVGTVFDVDFSKKEAYTLNETDFLVTKTEEAGFNKYLHKLKSTGAEQEQTSFTVRTFMYGDRDAVVFSTGLKVSDFSVYYKEDSPLYLHVKTGDDSPKYYHFVHDSGLWLDDGVFDTFQEEDVWEKLQYVQDGLGNEFSLDLAEDLGNKLFNVDFVEFDLVPGYMKYTYKPEGMEYPFLLSNLLLSGSQVNLPLTVNHLFSLTVYTFRKNYLFFHVVTYDRTDLFYKSDFEGGYTPVTFDRFDEESLAKVLKDLKSRVADQLSLELTKETSYPYHEFTVNVVLQNQTSFEGYKKYLHDLVDGTTSVPFKLASVKNDGYVTNVPLFNELVYFAYVYMHENTPLLLELHSSKKNMNSYHYYYFANNLGNWELLENPSLGQLPSSNLKEVLNTARDRMARTFKVDLSRKFSSKLLASPTEHFHLNVQVTEDTRETWGFSLYSHVYSLVKTGNAENVSPPTAANLNATTVLEPSSDSADRSPQQEQQEARVATSRSLGRGAVPSTLPDSVVQTPEGAPAAVLLPEQSALQPDSTRVVPAVERVLNTYQTLKANALRGVNVMSAALPVVGKFTLGDTPMSGFGVDTVFKVNVYWWLDHEPAFVHLYNGVNNKYYMKKGDKWALATKSDLPLSRATVASMLEELKDTFVKPVELDLDKSSSFDSYVKYVSEGLTLRVVPSHSLDEGFRGFTHFSATNHENVFRVNKLELWGDIVLTNLHDGFVRSATVFTDGDLLPLVLELEWTKLNNSGFKNKYKYFKYSSEGSWVVHPTDNNNERLPESVLLRLLKEVKAPFANRVSVSLERRENYGKDSSAVVVTKDPVTAPKNWNGFHKVSHALNNTNARMLLLKMSDRVVRAYPTATYVKRVDSFWYKNSLLLVKLTEAGVGDSSQDTVKYFKNDHKDDLVLLGSAPDAELTVGTYSGDNVATQASALLMQLAAHFKDEYFLDVAERTLGNKSDRVKLLPALHVVDTSVPKGVSRYNLYVLDELKGVKLNRLLYHGTDFSTGNFPLPEDNVYSVYVFTPVGHFSPFFLELHVRTSSKLVLFYYHLSQYGKWVKLETGGRRLTNQEFYDKLNTLSAKLGKVTVVDVSKNEGTYYGLTRMNVTKFSFPGVRGYTKYLHKAHDNTNFTVSKFVNKGVVMQNLPVMKASQVAVYFSLNKPLMLELKVGGRYKFFSSNANGQWFEARLPSGDLKSALDSVYDEHADVARNTANKVSLHLNANFTREYVLSEGKVKDFEGAVAVPEEEPEEAVAPRAPSRVDAPDSVGDANLSTALSSDAQSPQAAVTVARTPAPPAEQMVKTHVLNPLLYVENDKLSYSYSSYGKTVFVNRRDDMFHGYNVTTHKFSDNAPFSVRRVMFLGREFDLGLADRNFLSATLFSSSYKPLVLKLVQLDGAEKFFSFTFLTQTWEALQVSDLEKTLDDLNYKENKLLMLDLAKESNYEVCGKELHGSKTPFTDGFSKHTTQSKRAFDARDKLKAKRDKQYQEKLKNREKYRLEAEDKKRKLDSLTAKLPEAKGRLDSLLDLWLKLEWSRAALFKTFYEKEAAVASLEKAVALAEAEYEEAESTGSRDTGDKRKAMADKKEQLVAKKKELESAKQAASESFYTVSEPTSADTTSVKAKLAEAVTAAKAVQPHVKPSTFVDESVTSAKALRKNEEATTLPALVLAAEKLAQLKSGDKLSEMTSALNTLKDLVLDLKSKFESGSKYDAAHTFATNLKATVASVTSFEDTVTSANFVSTMAAVKKLKESLLQGPKLTEAYDSAVKFKFVCQGMEKLKEASALLAKLAPDVDSLLALEAASDLSSTSTDHTKYAKATALLSTLKEAVKGKLDVVESASNVRDEYNKFKSDLVADTTSAKFTLALAAFDKLEVSLSLATKLKEFVEKGEDPELKKTLAESDNAAAMELAATKALSAKLKELAPLAEKLKTFDQTFKAAVDPQQTSSSSDPTKLKKLSDSAEAFSESLKTEALKKVELALREVEKLKGAESALKLLEEAAKVASTVKEMAKALSADEDKTTLVEMQAFVSRLKEDLKDFEKLGKAYDAAKKVNDTLADDDKLKKAYDTSKALNDKVLEANKQTTDEQRTEKMKAVLLAFKEKKGDLMADNVTSEAKKQVTAKKEELNNSLKTPLKEGCNGAKNVLNKLSELVAEAQKSYDVAFRRYDLYDMSVRVSDDDDDGSPESSPLFGFGGLRLAGKNLSSAGLPVGNFLHTFNAYFANGSELPLMVQLKYSDSEDVDEPVVEKMKRPPPANLLLNAELPSTTAAPASQVQAPTEAGAGAAGTTTFTNAVQRVSSLLRTGLVEVTPKVSTETAQVVTSATPASGPDSRSAPDTEQSPPPPREPAPFSYPGHFFVLDLDHTWKPFVPEAKGSLRHKLLELKQLHALDVNVDFANMSARRRTTYALNTQTFFATRVLYSSGYKLTRDQSKLQGSDAPTKPNVVDLSDYDESVKFFPPLNFKWFVHQMAPRASTDANKQSDPLPQFNLQAVSFNGHRLSMEKEASDALLGTVNSVSALLNADGTPLMLLAYKPVTTGNVVQHRYVVLSLKGDKFALDDSMVNFSSMMYNLEHTDFAWTTDETFTRFVDAMQQRLNTVNAQFEHSYVVNLDATKNYKRGNMMVNVESLDAFDVKFVSFTPGLLTQAPAEGAEQVPMPSTVPAFTLEKVFFGDTVFQGFNLPFKNVLHVSAFHYKFLRPLKEGSPKEYSFFPLVLELSHRNEANRLENFYFKYLSGNKFELFFKTKMRLTASEVADVVRFVARENLRRGEFTPSTLNLDFSVKSTFYSPRHLVTVEKMEKVQAALAPGATEGTLPTPTNPHLPDGYNVYKYTLHQNDTPYTVMSLFFWNHWKFSPNKFTSKEFYLYVRARDNLADLLALVTPAGTGTSPTYDWYSLATSTPTAVFAGEVVSPTSSADKQKLETLLATVTANVDFWLQPHVFLWAFFTSEVTAKLSPVGNVQGFPVTPQA